MRRCSVSILPTTLSTYYSLLKDLNYFHAHANNNFFLQAKPLNKLCEHEGKRLPRSYESDCWGDVDETEYACSAKKRILLKLKPPGSENAIIDNYVPIFRKGEYKIKKVGVDAKDLLRQREEAKRAREEEEKNESQREPKNDF